MGELDELVERGFDVVNYYSDLYDALTFAEDSLIGRDDYQSVFKYLRIAHFTLEFVNKKDSINPENCLKITREYMEDVRGEIYKRM